ncbi:MAG: CoA-binding protein [Candidatus Anstonellaceae archaeon]
MFELNKNYFYAVVGATQNKEKYGYKVLMDLFKKGFNVVAINPKYKKIENISCFPSLSASKRKIDVAIFVVPPSIGAEILKECVNLKITKVWFQPGASSKDLIDFCKQHSIDYFVDACIIQTTNK